MVFFHEYHSMNGILILKEFSLGIDCVSYSYVPEKVYAALGA